MLRTPSSAVPPAPPPPPFVMPSRLPDNRTPEQIGGKVAEVLWGYYGQHAAAGTPLTSAVAPGAASPAYDDAYADTLLAEPLLAEPLFAEPLIAGPAPVAPRHPPVVARPAFAAPAVQVAAAPVLPRPHVVQLGFMDGTTLELAGDHPAAKALRAAADALTLRE